MVKGGRALGYSERLGRSIRKDEPEQLGVPTFTLIEEAIREGRVEDALALVDYWYEGECTPSHYFFFDWMYANQTFAAANFGEEHIEGMYRFETGLRPEHKTESHPGPRTIEGFPAELLRVDRGEELAKRQMEMMRSHYLPPGGRIWAEEEEDRYVLNFDPCNSGGRMMRSGMTGPPWSFGVTQKPHRWTWNRAGVPYYCAHCVLGRGIMAVEARGFPVRVHEPPGHPFHPDADHPNHPCRMLFYKRPELIPQEYWEAMGEKKDPSKFQVW